MQAYQRALMYRIKMQELYNEANKAILNPKLTPEQKLKLIGIRDTLKTKL